MKRFSGERRAVAAAVLAFYALIFLLVALTPPAGWGPCFAALAGVYGLGFFALVAGYFWARWYAIGIGMSGFISGLFSMWQMGPEPILLFYSGTHVLASLILWGSTMAALFDGQAEWRKRFHMDEPATHRLGKAIIRAGISLPYIVMYALAPRQDAAMTMMVIASGLVAVVGIWALVNLRTWGVVAMVAGAAAVLGSLSSAGHVGVTQTLSVDLAVFGLMAAGMLVAAALPFAKPIARYLRR
jgi:hypothetical protein